MQVKLDYAQIPVGASSGDITVASGDIEQSIPLSINLKTPELLVEYPDTLTFEKGTFTHAGDRELVVTLEELSVAPWHLADLPDWLEASAISGDTSISPVLTPADTPVADGLYEATIALTIDVTGAPITRAIDVRLEADGLQLMARDYSLAHGDYGTPATHSGAIHISNMPEEELELWGKSNADWLQIGDWNASDLNYRLQTDALTEGLHYATVTIGADNANVTPARVEVAYYKSFVERESYEQTIAAGLNPIAADKLAPYIYLTTTGTNTLEIFDLHSESYQTPLVLGDDRTITHRVFSDDGQTLFLTIQESGAVEAWNLRNHRLRYETEALSSIESIQYLRASGKPVLYVGATWIDAETGDLLDIQSGLSGDIQLGTADLLMSPLGNGFYGADDTCDIYFQDLTFDGANQQVAWSEPRDVSFSDCTAADLDASYHGDYITFSPRDQDAPLTRYTVTPLNLSSTYSNSIGARARLAMAAASDGKVYSLARVEEEGDSRFEYQYHDELLGIVNLQRVGATWVPEPTLLVSPDSAYTFYVVTSESDSSHREMRINATFDEL